MTLQDWLNVLQDFLSVGAAAIAISAHRRLNAHQAKQPYDGHDTHGLA
jgi:hypothetical protein